MKKLGLEPLDILDIIEEWNLSILTEENCKFLFPIMPIEKEIKEVTNNFIGDALNDLNEVDQYILIISGTIGYKERIKAILLYYNYRENSLFLLKEMLNI